MTLLYLVRHGQTDWNRQGRFQGHIDIPLNRKGEEEAERLGLRLAAEPVSAIYCSDLTRAHQTALPAAARLGLTPRTSAALRERDYGIFEGHTLAEIARRYPEESARWSTHDARYTIPNGESQETFRTRIFAFIDQLRIHHLGQSVLVVTHGGALDMMYRRALSLAWDAARSCPVPNAALNRLRLEGERVVILSWADGAHIVPRDRA